MDNIYYNPAASSASASAMYDQAADSAFNPGVSFGKDWVVYGNMIQDMNNFYQMEYAKQQQEAAQSSADRAMVFEDQQALRARQWQLEDRETAYQVAMKDMKKAGLNPALAYKQGGASVGAPIAGTGSMAAMSQSGYDSQSLVDILRQSMKNQSAVEVTALSKVFDTINTMIGGAFSIANNKVSSTARIIDSLIGVFDFL